MANPANHDPIEFREQKTGQITSTPLSSRDGGFTTRVPEGRYDVRQGSVHRSVTVLPGGSYDVDLRPDRVLDFNVTAQHVGNSDITLRVSAEGAGHHTFTVRSDNLTLRETGQQEINLTSAVAHEIVWHAHIVSPKTPWVALIIPDGTLDARREITGVISTTASETNEGKPKAH
jgi:hypothetical protein